MAETKPTSSASKTAGTSDSPADRMPTNEELPHDLRKHEAQPIPPAEIPEISRRTREFLLLSGTGSLAIGFMGIWLFGDAGLNPAARIAFTGIVMYCGILWYIFYGVMNRY